MPQSDCFLKDFSFVGVALWIDTFMEETMAIVTKKTEFDQSDK